MTGDRWLVLVASASTLFVVACDDGGGDAQVQECTPEGACVCVDGVERATRCTCTGGSTCTVEGDNIEFQCEGNAACTLTCGTNCLITCPGTTTCTIVTGDDGVIRCPGTATCDITCRGDCTVDLGGAAQAVVHCEQEGDGATCTFTSCSPTDCGGGVYACRTACPAAD